MRARGRFVGFLGRGGGHRGGWQLTDDARRDRDEKGWRSARERMGKSMHRGQTYFFIFSFSSSSPTPPTPARSAARSPIEHIVRGPEVE